MDQNVAFILKQLRFYAWSLTMTVLTYLVINVVLFIGLFIYKKVNGPIAQIPGNARTFAARTVNFCASTVDFTKKSTKWGVRKARKILAACWDPIRRLRRPPSVAVNDIEKCNPTLKFPASAEMHCESMGNFDIKIDTERCLVFIESTKDKSCCKLHVSDTDTCGIFYARDVTVKKSSQHVEVECNECHSLTCNHATTYTSTQARSVSIAKGEKIKIPYVRSLSCPDFEEYDYPHWHHRDQYCTALYKSLKVGEIELIFCQELINNKPTQVLKVRNARSVCVVNPRSVELESIGNVRITRSCEASVEHADILKGKGSGCEAVDFAQVANVSSSHAAKYFMETVTELNGDSYKTFRFPVHPPICT